MGRKPVLCTASVARFESLEPRQLFAAFSAHVDFTPTRIAAPSGYVADNGKKFADRGNGYSYGWNVSLPAAQEHLLRTKLANDVRYETVAISYSARSKKLPANSWSIAVPDGQYVVHLVVGDGSVGWGRSQTMINGTVVLDSKATMQRRWLDTTVDITVTNGMITLANGPKTKINKLAYIDITQQIAPAGPTTPTDPTTPTTPTTPTNPTPPTDPVPPTTPTAWTTPLVWSSVAADPSKLAEAQGVTVGGKLYVFGGYNITSPDYQATTSANVYDPTTNTWSAIAPMPQPETHMGVASDGTYIYIAGGYTYDPKTTYQTFGTANVWRYDIAHNTWSQYVSLPAARAAGSLVLLGDELHFFDGVSTDRVGHTDHWVLNITDASPKWTASTSLPFSRNHMAGVVLDGKIYAIGGQASTNDSDPSSDVLVWDPANPGAWQAVASLPAPLSHAVVTVVQGRIVVCGGTTTGDKPLASVYSYDPDTNKWTTETSLPAPRLAPTGGVIGNQIFVTTGYDDGLQSQTWVAIVA